MNSPFVERYLSSLSQYKWVALGSFAVIVGISSIAALQKAPPSGYIAEGVLTYNNPPVTFSNVSTQIQNLGKQLSPDILLADNVIKAVAEKMKVDSQRVRQNASVQIPLSEQPPLIAIKYRDGDAKQAVETAGYLMEAMIQQSRLINTARLQNAIATIEKRLPQANQEVTDTQSQLSQVNRGDTTVRSASAKLQLEQQLKLKQEFANKIQAALAEAKAAQPEIVSSLAVARLPQIIPKSYNTVFLILGTGLLVGVLVSGGLIPLLGMWKQQAVLNKEERDRLETILFRLLKENNGRITLLRFALETQLPAEKAQQFLDAQAEAFNASSQVSEEGGIHYNFHLD